MAEAERNLTPDELIELVDNNTNVVGQILNSAKKQRHFLYVTLLRDQVMNSLFPARSMNKQTKQNRLRRYISHIYNTHFGENGEVFATNSTKELYDEMLTLVRRRINDLKERKRSQGKSSNEATTGQNDSPVVRQARRVRRTVAPAPAAAAPAAAPAAAAPAAAPAAAALAAPRQRGQRRRASSSPKSDSPEAARAAPELEDPLALLMGDLNLAAQRPRTAVRRRLAADNAAQERERQEANAAQARQRRQEIAADTRRAARGELADLLGNIQLRF
jgi:hypothetical protein